MQGFTAFGRFDRSPESLAHQVAHETAVDHCSWGMFSEVANPERAAALALDGWTVTHDGGPGKGECGIITKDALRPVKAQAWFRLTNGGGPGRLKQPIYAPAVITEAPSGRVTLFTTAHLPAHVEGIWRLIPLPSRTKAKMLLRSKNARIRTYVTAVQAWRAQTMHLAAKHHVDDIVVGADWNLKDKAKWVQHFIHGMWPGLTQAAAKKPDLGKRNVGWLLTTMELVAAEVHKDPASDHAVDRFTTRHVNKPKPKPTTKPTPAPKPPDPFEKVVYNGALMDQKTKTFVQMMEKRLKFSLTILQGCYNAGGVSASAGTHDLGGVVDLAPFDQANKVHVGRWLGGFGWHRPFNWDGHNGGEHIHMGIRNHGNLSPSAARQQVQYDAHPPTNGLANFGPDNAAQPSPPVGFSYLAAWHEINDPA